MNILLGICNFYTIFVRDRERNDKIIVALQ